MLRGVEVGHGERGQATVAGDGDRVRVVVHADTVSGQMLEIAADPSADLENAAQIEPADIPAIWSLDVEKLLPACGLEALQPGRIVGAGGALTGQTWGRCRLGSGVTCGSALHPSSLTAEAAG